MKKCVALILALLCLGAFALAEEDALAALTEHHGSLVSTNGEPVTDEELSAVLAACQVVTLGSEKTLHLNVITDLDLLQELLPTYAAAGLVQRGNAAIIVCVSSDRGTSGQYHQPDMSHYVAGGMLAQQICVAAQLKGLGFRVITDCIHESDYSLYAGNEPAPENAVGPLLADGLELLPLSDGAEVSCQGLSCFTVNAAGARLLRLANGSNTLEAIIARTGMEAQAEAVADFFITLGKAGYLQNRVEVNKLAVEV